MVKLFVVGFPRDMDEVELVELFSAYGVVSTVRIITDKDSGISKGYGFLEMEDGAGAQRAIDAMNGATIDEREISVRVADDKRAAVNGNTFSKPSYNKPQGGGYKRENPRYETPSAPTTGYRRENQRPEPQPGPARGKRPRRSI